MKNTTKKWLIIAVSLIIFGIAVFAIIMSACNWDFTKLNTTKYETNTYNINQKFSNVTLNTNTADITFLLSDDENCKIECFEEQNSKHVITIQDDTLVIDNVSQKAWYDHVGINFGSPKITIYLPKAEYGELIITHSTGDITLENITAENIDISLSTGDLILENVQCKNFTSSASTGDIKFKKVISEEKITLTRSTGDIFFEESDAAGLDITTDTGDVTGSLLSEKIFSASTSTGDIAVPDTNSGGECKITTSTGDIQIKIAN